MSSDKQTEADGGLSALTGELDLAYTICPMCGFEGAGTSEARLNVELVKMRNHIAEMISMVDEHYTLATGHKPSEWPAWIEKAKRIMAHNAKVSGGGAFPPSA